jgi:hypothetical protein
LAGADAGRPEVIDVRDETLARRAGEPRRTEQARDRQG